LGLTISVDSTSGGLSRDRLILAIIGALMVGALLFVFARPAKQKSR